MKVKFVPIDKEFEITPDVSIKDLCHDKGIFVKSLCNGLPSCAECRVHIVEGEHNVLPPSAKELSLIGTGYFIDRRRLSCQLRCFGDVTIDISEQLEKENEDQQERRPQGAIKKDASESSLAVLGSFLEQEGELDRAEPARQERGNGNKNKPRNPRGSRSRHKGGKQQGDRAKVAGTEGSGESQGANSNSKQSAKTRRSRQKKR